MSSWLWKIWCHCKIFLLYKFANLLVIPSLIIFVLSGTMGQTYVPVINSRKRLVPGDIGQWHELNSRCILHLEPQSIYRKCALLFALQCHGGRSGSVPSSAPGTAPSTRHRVCCLPRQKRRKPRRNITPLSRIRSVQKVDFDFYYFNSLRPCGAIWCKDLGQHWLW